VVFDRATSGRLDPEPMRGSGPGRMVVSSCDSVRRRSFSRREVWSGDRPLTGSESGFVESNVDTGSRSGEEGNDQVARTATSETELEAAVTECLRPAPRVLEDARSDSESVLLGRRSTRSCDHERAGGRGRIRPTACGGGTDEACQVSRVPFDDDDDDGPRSGPDSPLSSESDESIGGSAKSDTERGDMGGDRAEMEGDAGEIALALDNRLLRGRTRGEPRSLIVSMVSLEVDMSGFGPSSSTRVGRDTADVEARGLRENSRSLPKGAYVRRLLGGGTGGGANAGVVVAGAAECERLCPGLPGELPLPLLLPLRAPRGGTRSNVRLRALWMSGSARAPVELRRAR
jgi:hypothetical protein